MTAIVQVFANLLAIKDFMINGGKKDEWIQMMTTVSDQVQTLVLAAGTSAADDAFLNSNRSFLTNTGAGSVTLSYNGTTYSFGPTPAIYMMSYAEREFFIEQDNRLTVGLSTLARSTYAAYQTNGVVQYYFD